MPPRRPPEIPAGAPTIGGGRYILANRIGEGGMAGVYRAWDTRLRVWRAVKVLFPQYARRVPIRKRFEAEAHAMARLEHENLVRMYDVEDTGELPFLVMELVHGGTLHDWVEHYGPMPPQMACIVIRQVAAGVGAAHEAGIIHRDVKPQNVLIAPSGLCKLTDFGIALQTDHGLTRPGVALGTIGYMAPEQRADATNVDPRADLYGLGATLWTLVAGEIAHDLFNAGSKPQLLAMIPEALQPLIRVCCAYEPTGRFGSVDALDRALAAALQQLPSDPRGSVPLTAPLRPDGELSERPDFPEIRAILEVDGKLPSKPDPTPSGEEGPQALPYVMPKIDKSARSLRGESGVVPAYVDKESLARTPAYSRGPQLTPLRAPQRAAQPRDLPAPRSEVIGVDPGAAPSSPAPPPPRPAPPSVDEPVRPPPRTRRRSDRAAVRMAAAVLGVGSILAFTVVVIFLMGVADIGSARQSAMESRFEVHNLLGERANGIVAEMPVKERAPLEQAYLRYLEARDEPGRTQAALTFLDELDRVAPKGQAGAANPVNTTVRQLRAARVTYERDVRAWSSSASGFPGALLVVLGVAQGPPPVAAR